MPEHTFGDLIKRVAELREHGSAMAMIMVQVSGRNNDVIISKAENKITLNYQYKPFFGFLKVRRFRKFAKDNNFLVFEEDWGVSKNLQIRLEPNDYEVLRVVKMFFKDVHNLPDDYCMKISCADWDWSPAKAEDNE